MWRKDNELIYDGAEINNKKRVNLILAIDKSEIILGHYDTYETIGSEEFIIFLKEVIEKLGEDNINNYIFILDNATYHLSRDVKVFAESKKLKFLFNCPYKSEFNAIEMVFNLIKTNLYKEIFIKQNQLTKRIEFYLNDPDTNKKIMKIYEKTLEKYLEFYTKNIDKLKEAIMERKQKGRKKKINKSNI